jgi:hypothetical protein
MTYSHLGSTGDRIVELMIALARCSNRQPIIVAGARSVELASELSRRGFVRVASTASCGLPAGQYDVALVDWRRRTLRALETRLDSFVDFLSPEGLLVIWTDPQKSAVRQGLCSKLEQRGLVIEDSAVREYGSAVSARRREVQIPKAA